MKKNWKCIIGATLLTPICGAIIVGLKIGLALIMTSIQIIVWIFACIIGLGFFLALWVGLYDHCKKYWKKKENNK